MKKIAFWNNYTDFANNQAFNPSAYGIGEDLGYPIILLKEKLAEKGYLFETLDMDKPENYEAILFSDYPNRETCCVDFDLIPKEKRYLKLEECEMIYKPNSRTDLLNEFNKVFSYNDNLVRNNGYTKLNMANKFKNPLYVSFLEKKFSVLIAGNKKSNEKGELYSERLRAIRFMEKNYPKEFDLYGIGWGLYTFSGIRPIRALNKITTIRKLFSEKRPSYKGKVEKKLDVLSKYKFCFCYENSCAIPGYISEKIWDCFFAGCIPIYYGAPNILDYIPSDIFIDFRKFASYFELYDFLKNMTHEEYEGYLTRTREFLTSDKAYQFSAECFADTIIKEIIK